MCVFHVCKYLCLFVYILFKLCSHGTFSRCIYMYICTYICTHTKTYVYIFIYAFVYVSMYLCIYVHMHDKTRHFNTCVRTHTCIMLPAGTCVERVALQVFNWMSMSGEAQDKNYLPCRCVRFRSSSSASHRPCVKWQTAAIVCLFSSHPNTVAKQNSTRHVSTSQCEPIYTSSKTLV